MAGLDDDFDVDWESASVHPFNMWTISEVVQVNENGVSTDVVLYLHSEQTGETIACLLHPHTAASIGLDLVTGYIDNGT